MALQTHHYVESLRTHDFVKSLLRGGDWARRREVAAVRIQRAARCRLKVDEFVPWTQDVNLRIVALTWRRNPPGVWRARYQARPYRFQDFAPVLFQKLTDS